MQNIMNLTHQRILQEQPYSFSIIITVEMIAAFANLTGDTNPLHLDPVQAAAMPFGGVIAHGMLVMALSGRFIGDANLHGTINCVQTVHYHHPAYPGDILTYHVTLTQFNEFSELATFTTQCHNQNNILIMTLETQALLPED